MQNRIRPLALVRVMVIVFVAAASLSYSGVADAAVGGLTQGGCIADNGDNGCVNPGAAPPPGPLAGLVDVALSPDGASLYALSPFSATISRATRNPDGSLTPQGCIGSPTGCTHLTQLSMAGARSVAVSPDGTSVYVAAKDGDSVTRFARAVGGTLTQGGCVANAGANGCTDPALDSLDGADDVAVSPDGQSVYVVSEGGSAVTQFARAGDGALMQVACIAHYGANGCATPAINNTLLSVQHVIVSADGKSVYTNGSGALNVFSRDSNGTLAQVQCFDNVIVSGCTQAALSGSRDLTLSPDDGSLYATAGSQLIHFSRAADGLLTQVDCVGIGLGCVNPPVNSMNNAAGVAVAPDGLSVYVAAENGSSITTLDRSASGSLIFAGCISYQGQGGCADQPVDSLQGASSVVVSGDGSSVYVGSKYGNAVTHFRRELPPDATSEPMPPALPGPALDHTPPNTKFKSRPRAKTKKHAVTFKLAASESGSRFQCRLNGGKIKQRNYRNCKTSITYKNLKFGKYTFQARSIDGSGNVDPSPVKYVFRVVR